MSTVLLQVADSVQTLSSLTQILDTVVRLTPMLTGLGRCGVMLWDEPTGAFVPAAIYGVSRAQQETFELVANLCLEKWRPSITYARARFPCL